MNKQTYKQMRTWATIFLWGEFGYYIIRVECRKQELLHIIKAESLIFLAIGGLRRHWQDWSTSIRELPLNCRFQGHSTMISPDQKAAVWAMVVTILHTHKSGDTTGILVPSPQLFHNLHVMTQLAGNNSCRKTTSASFLPNLSPSIPN